MNTVFPPKPGDNSEQQFLARFGGVYESSCWIAQQLWRQSGGRPPGDIETLASALAGIVDNASPEQKLALIRAHPDLAGRAALAGALTAESRSEQASAGLDHCTPAELAQFKEMNERYTTAFGFPFIMAVKGADRHQILAGFTERLGNDRQTELSRAIKEIHKIARLRLEEIARNGR